MHHAYRALPFFLAMIAAAALAGACTHKDDAAAQAAGVPSARPDTLAFVQAACSQCHAVEAGYLSPDSLAPRWEDIANLEGLTRATLASWLYDAHNYPEMMDFELDPLRADQIADFILAMRSSKYRPVPQ